MPSLTARGKVGHPITREGQCQIPAMMAGGNIGFSLCWLEEMPGPQTNGEGESRAPVLLTGGIAGF